MVRRVKRAGNYNTYQQKSYDAMKGYVEMSERLGETQGKENLQKVRSMDLSEIEERIFSNLEKGEPIPYNYLMEIRTERPLEFLALSLKHSFYGFPTDRVINFIKKEIEGEIALEIGAGNGWFSKCLGIEGVDNYQQKDKVFKAYYESIGQAPIEYINSHVVKADAIEYVKKIKPSVVIGSYITDYGKLEKDKKTSAFGIKDWEIFDNGVKKYIFIGSTSTHKGKKLLNDDRFNVEIIRDKVLTRGQGEFVAVITKK